MIKDTPTKDLGSKAVRQYLQLDHFQMLKNFPTLPQDVINSFTNLLPSQYRRKCNFNTEMYIFASASELRL